MKPNRPSRFSGVAYAIVQPDESIENARIHTVSDWEGRLPGRATSSKVPTEIAFDDEDGGKPYWGFDIPDHLKEKKIKYIKLFLEPEISRKISRLSRLVDLKATRACLEKGDRSPIEVAGAFIKCLWEHSKRQIIQHKGQATWNWADKVVLLTVPAIWSEQAKHNTYMVAFEAGLVSEDITLQTISEPEAAVVALLTDESRAGSLKKDDIYMVVDAGGGTVDLISYQVKCRNPLRLEEVVAGDGDACGAVFLETNFLTYLGQRVGPKIFSCLDALYKERIICDWEDSIRAMFTGEDNRRYVLITPGIPEGASNGIRNGMMKLLAEDIQPIFEPVVDRVDELVDKQISALKREGLTPTSIVLVGGLGSNRYLAIHLRKQYSLKGSRPRQYSTEIQQPDIAWESVAHGAVACEILGYMSVVSLRIARFNIGIGENRPWHDDGRFVPQQKIEDPYDGKLYAEGCVSWAVRRGQKLEKNKYFSLVLWTCYWQSEVTDAIRSGSSLLIRNLFLASQEENASENFAPGARVFMVVDSKFNPKIIPPDSLIYECGKGDRLYLPVADTIHVTQGVGGLRVRVQVFGVDLEEVEVDFHTLADQIDGAQTYGAICSFT